LGQAGFFSRGFSVGHFDDISFRPLKRRAVLSKCPAFPFGVSFGRLARSMGRRVLTRCLLFSAFCETDFPMKLFPQGNHPLCAASRWIAARRAFGAGCANAQIDHRLIPPRHPQTNGMPERFNGHIRELLPGTALGAPPTVRRIWRAFPSVSRI
jgi:hypothetical protein